MKYCAIPILLLIGALAPAGPTLAVSANQQMEDGPIVADLPNVAGMQARDVYSTSGERIGELSEIVLNDANRPVAALIQTDEGTRGEEHIVGAKKLRLRGASQLVTNLTRQQVEAMPRAND